MNSLAKLGNIFDLLWRLPLSLLVNNWLYWYPPRLDNGSCTIPHVCNCVRVHGVSKLYVFFFFTAVLLEVSVFVEPLCRQ